MAGGALRSVDVNPVLATDRLIARAWTTSDSDLEAAYDIYSRLEVARWLGASTDPAEIRVRVEGWAEPTGDPTYGVWAVEERAHPGYPIGSVLLRPLPPADEDVEIAWHLHPDKWGNGYATEIGRAAAERAFRTGIDEVFAIVRPGNERSNRVAERLGMEYVGTTEKYYGLRFALYRLRPADLTPGGLPRISRAALPAEP
jgi:[ribosomal protein S5]-alanine N-acetyltransferase